MKHKPKKYSRSACERGLSSVACFETESQYEKPHDNFLGSSTALCIPAFHVHSAGPSLILLRRQISHQPAVRQVIKIHSQLNKEQK
jgi:hypothetical protein